MSLIVHSNRVMYADRSGQSKYEERTSFHELTKLHVSADKHFAIMLAGVELNFKSPAWRSLEKKISATLCLSETTGKELGTFTMPIKTCLNIAWEMEKVEKEGGISIVIMTRTSLYTMRFDRVDGKNEFNFHFESLPPNLFITHGSGLFVFECLLATGMPILDAMLKTPRYEYTMFPTGIDTVKASELAPFPKPVKAPKATKPKKAVLAEDVLDMITCA